MNWCIVKRFILVGVILVLGLIYLSGCEEEPTEEPIEPEEVDEPEEEAVDEPEPEYQTLSSWSYNEVEIILKKRDTTLSIDQINEFLENENIILEKNLLRDNYYEYYYCEGERGDANYEYVVAFGEPERLKHVDIRKGFRLDSARQYEETLMFMESFIEEIFYDWERGREWFLDNLEANEINKTYFIHKDEYFFIKVALIGFFGEPEITIMIESAE